MSFENSIGIIEKNDIIFHKKHKRFCIEEIISIEIKVIKNESLYTVFYVIVFLLLILDLFFQFNNNVKIIIKALVFSIILIIANFKFTRKCIEVLYDKRNKIIIPIKNSEVDKAEEFIDKFFYFKLF